MCIFNSLSFLTCDKRTKAEKVVSAFLSTFDGRVELLLAAIYLLVVGNAGTEFSVDVHVCTCLPALQGSSKLLLA